MGNQEIAIKIENLYKRYRLGAIGGGTLTADLQSWWAVKRGKEDPNTQIGSENHQKHGTFMAVDGIDFEIYKGQRVGIIGGNGAGKSTTLKMLSRVTAPTEGEIKINGRISSMLEVGTGFHPELTGRENIYLNGAILGMTHAEVDMKIESIIDFSECREFIDTPVKRYSSGMYVKLAFAVSSHLDSEILIMDEVLAVGDMKFQQKCLNKMKQLAEDEGRTILYVSHNMSTITQLCNRCIVLKKGKIVFDGDVDEAIKIYMDNGLDSEIRKHYDSYVRPSWLQLDDLRITEAGFMEKDSNIYFDNEPILLNVKWRNKKEIHNLCLRWEIRTSDGIPIGTSLIENFYNSDGSNEGNITLAYQFPNLTEGEFISMITVYYKDEFGNNINVDCVPGPSFEKKLVQEKKIVWDALHWGYVEFGEPELKG
ncbi:MAG: polysaccharide ABC transporter ATP-binding protein [Anaerostipes sp.]|jgi:ABC-type polysaccharide/polyol phosphate transport system ATPase subunit|nr:polysaccharide ABC transporter ATP-binding protein [Anaerostipes sp.]MDD3745930.1 polysaccharide ABC transporter ATP-binding protein [Anaerostipes sp.]